MLGLSDRKNISVYIAYSQKPGFFALSCSFLVGGWGWAYYANIMDQEAINLSTIQ